MARARQAGGGADEAPVDGAAAGARPRIGRPGRLLPAILLAALCAIGCLGCAAGGQEASESSAAAVETAADDEAVVLRVAAPVGMQGMLEELADAYSAANPGVSFTFSFYNGAKKENREIAPKTSDAEDASIVDLLVPEDSSSSSASGSSSAAATLYPKAEVVFQSSQSAMDAAVEEGAADAATRSDMLQDRLVIVTSDESQAGAVTTADIEAGAVRLAVVSGSGVHAKRQYEVLEALGVYGDGKFRGSYAKTKDAVTTCDSTADLFDALGQDEELVAIVRTSDLYRYGGVRVAGAVPARLYSAMWFPQALGANLTALQNGEAVDEAARGFLSWMESDPSALDIIGKWGFYPAA